MLIALKFEYVSELSSSMVIFIMNQQNYSIYAKLNQQEKLCRFCFKELKASEEYFHIFNSDVLDKLKFSNIFNILNMDEFLPQFLCKICSNSLNSVYKFFQKIHSRELVLKGYLDSKRTEKNYKNSKNDEEEFIVVKIEDEDTELISSESEEKLTKTNHKKRIYNCTNCTKNYKSYFELEIHERTHTGEKPFSCSVCEKSFADSRNLKRHEKIHTGEKSHECNTCHKKFLHLFSLNIHKRIHTGEKPYVCENCGKACNTSGELKIHSRRHSQEKPYKCLQCSNKSFSNKSALNAHTRIHTDNINKQHLCKVCTKTCRTSYDLKVHLRCHSNERPYSCIFRNCNKSYKSSSQFHVHLRTHTGERLHQCYICLKRFGETNTLKRHLVIHANKI